MKATQKLHENSLVKQGFEVHPYVIIHGPSVDTSQIYVVLNKELYLCASLVDAVDKCFKCLMALRSWPYLCDHIWFFLMKRVYELTPPRAVGPISKL